MAKFKSVKKSRSNTSDRKSKAKLTAEKTSKRLKSKKATVITNKERRDRLAKGIPYKLKRLEAMPVRQLPDTVQTKQGMTLRQLIKCTPKLFLYNAVDVRARVVETKKTATGRPVVYGQMVTDDPFRRNKVKRIHEAYIIGMGDDDKVPVNKHRKVLVQCSCESFVYVFEYANATKGASRLIYSNGEPPVFTNPQLAPGCCKHLIALAKIVIEKNL